jgi:hypothetical protein
MPALSLPDPATLSHLRIANKAHHNPIERAGDAYIANDPTPEQESEDALDHKIKQDTIAGRSINVLTVSTEHVAGGAGRAFPDQEESYAKTERKAADKRRAQLEAMGISSHTERALREEARGLEHAIKHPESDRALYADVAKLAFILKRLGDAKIFETKIAPLLGGSKKQAGRYAVKGLNVLADLIRLSLNRIVDPAEALPYLASLPQDLQLAVGHEAERQREAWAIEHQIALHARAPKLDHGSLDALEAVPARMLDRDTRRDLSLLDAPERAHAIADMRLAEKMRLREAEDAERKRWRRSEERFAAAAPGSGRATRAVQGFLSLSPAERAHTLSALGLQPTSVSELT